MHIGGILCASLYLKTQMCFVSINVHVKTRGVLRGGTLIKGDMFHIDVIEIPSLNRHECTKS